MVCAKVFKQLAFLCLFQRSHRSCRSSQTISILDTSRRLEFICKPPFWTQISKDIQRFGSKKINIIKQGYSDIFNNSAQQGDTFPAHGSVSLVSGSNSIGGTQHITIHFHSLISNVTTCDNMWQHIHPYSTYFQQPVSGYLILWFTHWNILLDHHGPSWTIMDPWTYRGHRSSRPAISPRGASMRWSLARSCRTLANHLLRMQILKKGNEKHIQNLWILMKLIISQSFKCSFDGFGELNQHKNLYKNQSNPTKPNLPKVKRLRFKYFSGPLRWMLSNRLRPGHRLIEFLDVVIVLCWRHWNWNSSNL